MVEGEHYETALENRRTCHINRVNDPNAEILLSNSVVFSLTTYSFRTSTVYQSRFVQTPTDFGFETNRFISGRYTGCDERWKKRSDSYFGNADLPYKKRHTGSTACAS